MLVAFNFRCPGQMRKFHELLMSFGYTSHGCRLNSPQEEDCKALRIDTTRKNIDGKNPSYPDMYGDSYGCTIVTIDGQQQSPQWPF